MFDLLGDIISMPVRIAVDIVKTPIQILEGEDLFENTARGIEKIEEDLE